MLAAAYKVDQPFSQCSSPSLPPQPNFYTLACKLLILRSVNALLKRVSAPAAPALCGSMLMFLAKFFPLSERSGVNVAGLYNTGNVTHIEDVAEVRVSGIGGGVESAHADNVINHANDLTGHTR